MDELQNESQPVVQTHSSRVKLFAILFMSLACLGAGYFVFRILTAPKTVVRELPPVFANQDIDLDGLSDAEETKLGTDPKNRDTDGDGLPDGYEVAESKTDPKNLHSKDPVLTDSQWLQKTIPPR